MKKCKKTEILYAASDRCGVTKMMVGTAIAAVLSTILGIAYGAISDFNPLIYINFLVLVGMIWAIIGEINKIKLFGQSQSIIVNVIVGLILGFMACYGNWAYYLWQYGLVENIFQAIIHPGNTFPEIALFSQIRIITMGRRGSGGMEISELFLQILYVVEFLACLLPAFLTRISNYYCEDCEKFYKKTSAFVEDTQAFESAFE